MISRAPIPIESLAVTRPKDRERLLIIDTSVLLADSIASAVLAAGYGEARVAHCPNLALRLMGQRAPTMVLADLGLATDNEFELLQALAAEFSQARVIVMMDGEDDPQLAVDALLYGAAGLACRNLGVESLLRVLDLVREGETAVPRRLNRLLVNTLRQRPMRPAGKVQLSARQREVLMMVAKGATDKDISEALHISLTTVRSHLTAIFEKTETVNRTAAALWASAYIDEAAS
jgi:DNA-binding NarL/FixJ family response regulator